MNGRRSTAKAAGRLTKAEVHAASPCGYACADWLAREDPEYMRARQPLSQLPPLLGNVCGHLRLLPRVGLHLQRRSVA